MNVWICIGIPLVVVGALVVVALGGALLNLQLIFGVIVPYLAFAAFLVGFIYRVVRWGRSPVPFRIPTVCGQQKSLPWIKASYLESPYTKWGVVWRMALEILFFRSLFRNTAMELKTGPKLIYGSSKWLWIAALAFHYSFLTVVVRHLRFFAEPYPALIHLIESLDGFLQVGAPGVMISGLVLLGAVGFLFLRRVVLPQLRYISLPADYFPLFVIGAVAASGILLRYFTKVDVVAVKQLMMGLVTFQPKIPDGIGSLFYVHLFLVSVLIAYFPWSKLMHMGGVFLSPTRNLPNNSRAVRHVNPWNYPVPVHTYEEYEEEFRDKMIEAGLPVEKE